MATVAVFDKALRLSRASLEGPRLGQTLNFQVIYFACPVKFSSTPCVWEQVLRLVLILLGDIVVVIVCGAFHADVLLVWC